MKRLERRFWRKSRFFGFFLQFFEFFRIFDEFWEKSIDFFPIDIFFQFFGQNFGKVWNFGSKSSSKITSNSPYSPSVSTFKMTGRPVGGDRRNFCPVGQKRDQKMIKNRRFLDDLTKLRVKKFIPNFLVFFRLVRAKNRFRCEWKGKMTWERCKKWKNRCFRPFFYWFQNPQGFWSGFWRFLTILDNSG